MSLKIKFSPQKSSHPPPTSSLISFHPHNIFLLVKLSPSISCLIYESFSPPPNLILDSGKTSKLRKWKICVFWCYGKVFLLRVCVYMPWWDKKNFVEREKTTKWNWEALSNWILKILIRFWCCKREEIYGKVLWSLKRWKIMKFWSFIARVSRNFRENLLSNWRNLVWNVKV